MKFILDIANLAFLVLLTLFFLGLLAISLRRRYRDTDYAHFSCKALVIVPCKGRDIGLGENLKSLKEQAYESFDLVAVVDSTSDAALKEIGELGIEYLVSSASCKSCSGKVRAIASAMEKRKEVDVYVIADSDVLYPDNWLEALLCPLGDPRFGVSTTFPHFVPVGGFWSKVKSVWGLVGFGLMQSKITRFVWGGSMAFRSTLINKKSLSFFKKHVSDDVAIMRICKQSGLDICYVESAAPIVKSDDTYAVFKEWSNRQTALSVSSSTGILRFGLLFYIGQIFLLVSSVALSVLFTPVFVIFLIPYLLYALRNYRNHLTGGAAVFLISLAIPFISVLNLIKAAGMKEITWRGSSYDLTKQPD